MMKWRPRIYQGCQKNAAVDAIIGRRNSTISHGDRHIDPQVERGYGNAISTDRVLSQLDIATGAFARLEDFWVAYINLMSEGDCESKRADY